MLFVGTLMASLPAFAQSAGSGEKGMYAIAAGLGLALAALGGSMGQGKIGAAAMDGIARNPQAKDSLFIPMILALVFVETLVLFTFALAFLIQAKF
jgi:F-type H+-transporting ATPase subunit c